MKENSCKMVWEPSSPTEGWHYLWASDGDFYSPKITHRSTLFELICVFTLETSIFAGSCTAGGKFFLRGKVKTDFKDTCLNVFEGKNPHLLVMKLHFFPHSIMEMEIRHLSCFEKKLFDWYKNSFSCLFDPLSFNLWKIFNLVLKCFSPRLN